MTPRRRVGFIEPMLLLSTDNLPDDPARWLYQLKLDGYRAIAFKTGGKVYLRSRNDNDFGARYPKVVRGFAKLPNETVIDGELIALADDGRPSFNALQNYGSATTPITFLEVQAESLFEAAILAVRTFRGEPWIEHVGRPRCSTLRCASQRRNTRSR